MSESTGQKLMDSREAAAWLGVRPGTLAVWRSTRKVQIPHIKIGRLTKYSLRDLEAYLEKHRVEEQA